MTQHLLTGFGFMFAVWCIAAIAGNPYFENVRWRYIAGGLFVVASILITIGVSVS